MAAALRMRDAMRDFNGQRNGRNLVLKIGIQKGLAKRSAMSEDYFGQTVNIARACRAGGLALDLHHGAGGRVSADTQPCWRPAGSGPSRSSARYAASPTTWRLRDPLIVH